MPHIIFNKNRPANPIIGTAREAIEPSEGKTDKVITSLFGKQGGLYFNYDTKTKQLYIESRKTLRSTSGGEEVTDFFSSEPPINPKTGELFDRAENGDIIPGSSISVQDQIQRSGGQLPEYLKDKEKK